MLRLGWRLWQRISARDLGLIAAGVAFFGFLALFPALAAVVALWSLAADPAVVRDWMALAQDYLPADGYDLVAAQVESLLTATSRTIGLTTALSFLLALWSARAGVAALIQGLDAIHGLPARSGVDHVLRALVLTLTLVGLALAAMLLTLGTPLVLALLPLGRAEALALEIANLALGLGLVVAGLGLVYRFGPNRPDGRRPPLFTRGLLVAVVLWATAARGYVWYLASFTEANRVYGSIGAVAGLMIWFYLAVYAILLGAAIDAERARLRREGKR
ncbi:MAG TPA: YihY/virulence factor BrkB family protein [Paracoccaceae bacterium]|nr:YihY/virulence factor BrkB family protein [Paracoccaceae bacterium]HMO71425.1 YihY/virulence factor BrkB family protein [Paracoccaceae bacterium]